jgi:hypothetical protein
MRTIVGKTRRDLIRNNTLGMKGELKMEEIQNQMEEIT